MARELRRGGIHGKIGRMQKVLGSGGPGVFEDAARSILTVFPHATDMIRGFEARGLEATLGEPLGRVDTRPAPAEHRDVGDPLKPLWCIMVVEPPGERCLHREHDGEAPSTYGQERVRAQSMHDGKATTD